MRSLTKDRGLRSLGTACLLAASGLFLACGDNGGITSGPESESPTARQLTQVGLAYTPIDQHVFLMNGDKPAPADFQANVEANGGTVLRVHDDIGVVVTTGLTDVAAADLAQGIGQVERDLLVQWLPSPEELQAAIHGEEASDPGSDSHKPPATAAFFPLQWNMRNIHAPEAWATGREGSPNVRVAILDTGLDAYHIDQGNIIDVASSIAFTPSTQGPPTWEDDHFHGAHVGGIVTTNNIGTAGVVSHVTLIAIKVLNFNGQGSFADVIAGLIHAGNVQADVANLSLGATFDRSGGGGPLVSALNNAVNYANRHDVLVVSSAGNDAEDLQHNTDRIKIPCESGTGICISATDFFDEPSSYTNYGSNVIDLSAPGGDFDPAPPAGFVLSPCSSRSVQIPACRGAVGTRYLFVIGTSQAAPHVSGLAAYLDSQYAGTLPPSQLETTMQQEADDLGKTGKDPFYGHGRINVFRTVTTATAPATP
jgi:subtilisin family serine protease